MKGSFHEMEDENIIDLYLQRDESAISHTSDKYGRRLNALAKHITDDAGTADECENDTYMETWNRIPPNEPRDHFYPFLAAIVRHISLNRCEKNNALKRKGQLVDLGEELEMCIAAPDNTEAVIDDMALKESLNRFLRSLDEDKRNIFVRRYFFTDSISELAERSGYSESKLKSMLLRMREKLREQLGKDGIIV